MSDRVVEDEPEREDTDTAPGDTLASRLPPAEDDTTTTPVEFTEANSTPAANSQQIPDVPELVAVAAKSVSDETPAARFSPTPPRNVSASESFWKWEDVENAAREAPSADDVQALSKQLSEALASDEEKTRLLAFDVYRKDCQEQFVLVREEQDSGCFWIVGDLHGDILGLEAVLHYLETQPDPSLVRLIFLGDLFDRGKQGKKVLYRVLKLIVESPGMHGFIVGNHDMGLQYKDETGIFSSDVQPSEFADWLNTEPESSSWRQLARAAIELFEHAPRAVLLPDGLLIAHGGVPHVDIQDEIENQDDLNNPRMLQDFVWTRLHESAKRKIPNRTTRGCSLGIADFDAFCLRMKDRVMPVSGMVRGHDHLEARYCFFERYEQHPVLTINTMCYRQEGETFDAFHRPVIVAERIPGRMPVVHALEVPHALVERFYGGEAAPAS